MHAVVLLKIQVCWLCDVVSLGKQLPTFRRIAVPSSSGSSRPGRTASYPTWLGIFRCIFIWKIQNGNVWVSSSAMSEFCSSTNFNSKLQFEFFHAFQKEKPTLPINLTEIFVTLGRCGSERLLGDISYKQHLWKQPVSWYCIFSQLETIYFAC